MKFSSGDLIPAGHGKDKRGVRNMTELTYSSLLAMAGARGVEVVVYDPLSKTEFKSVYLHLKDEEAKIIVLAGGMTLEEQTKELAVMIGYSLLAPEGYNILKNRNPEIEKKLHTDAEMFAEGLLNGKISKRLIA